MRLFKNRPSMSFDDARAKPDQEMDVHVDVDGFVEYKPMQDIVVVLNYLAYSLKMKVVDKAV